MVVPAAIEPVPERAKPGRMQRRRGSSIAVELEIDGVSVRIASGADAGVIAAVIDALKTTRVLVATSAANPSQQVRASAQLQTKPTKISQ
ncbi:hypothetical protein ACX0GZ_06070 [Sphingomonas aestuarii]